MLTDLLTWPCSIVTRTATGELDRYRNPIYDETEVETVCDLQQRARTEDTQSGTVHRTTWALFLLPTAVLAVGDAVIVEGSIYEVVGDPETVRNSRTGEDDHVEATLVFTGGNADVGS